MQNDSAKFKNELSKTLKNKFQINFNDQNSNNQNL